jgi:flagellar motility protein MotE (MotC chaperone)
MLLLPSRFIPGRLVKPRLLPATIVAMSALLAVKSIVIVQAATEKAAASSPKPGLDASHAESAAPSAQPGSGAAVAIPLDGQTALARRDKIGSPELLPLGEGERKLLLDLRHRRETLDARAKDLDQRDAELGAAAKRLTERADELSSLQSRLEGLEAGRQRHASENWQGLVRVYEAMKPREAALIFDALDMQVLLQVLDRMQDRRAAPVLAAMQPDRARLATQMLAEMRAKAIGQSASPIMLNNTKG